MEKRITIQGHFKEIELNQEQFVARWRTNITEFFNLTRTTQEYNLVKECEEKLTELIKKEFDRIWEEQNNKV